MAMHLTLAMVLTVLPATHQQFQQYERYCPAGQHCYITSSLKSWSNAQESCKSLNAALPIVDSLEKQMGLVKAMENLGLNEVWIGATAVHHNWTWVDGTECGDCVSLSTTSGVFVAGLATYPPWNIPGVVYPHGSPAVNPQPFICQYSNPVACNETGLTSITTENSCYILYYDQLPWFSARNRCLENGGDLAAFHSIMDASALLNFSQTPPWVGLRNKWWYWNNAVTGQWKEVLFTQWTGNEPSNMDGFDCISTTSSGWKEKNCTQKLAFICQEHDTVTTALPESSTVNLRSEDEHPVQFVSCTNVGVGAGLGVGIPLIVIAAVIIVVIIWYNKSRTQKQNSSAAIYDNSSTSISAVNGPRDRPTSQQQTQDDRAYEGLDSSQRIRADDQAYEALEV